MAATLTTTGPYTIDTVNGVHTHFPQPTFRFCSTIITTPSTYQTATPDSSVLDFGGQLSELWIVNLGSNDLVFQWKEQWGTNVDGGYIPGGSKTPVRIPKCFKTGLAVRSADSALATTCVVFGY